MSRHLTSLIVATTAVVAPAQEKVTWQDHIRPIFENRCNTCHNADKKKGDLDLSTFAGVIAGGSGGTSVEAGDAAGSTLFKVISHIAEPVMPPKGDKIPQAEIDLIGKWISGGLLDTPDGTARVKKKAAFAMAASASNDRPAGPPPMPGDLLLEPVVTPARPNIAGAIAHSPWAPLTAIAAPRQILLYHSGTGELSGVLPFPGGGQPETVSFSRNGALVLAGGGVPGKQGMVTVWDIKTGQAVINIAMNEDFDTILAADISADLGKIAMGGPGRRIRIYDTRTSQLLANIKKHTDWVTALAFSPDGVLLATGDRNGGLYVWEAGTGNEFHNLRAHEKRIAAIAWRGDSNVLAAGSEDGNMTWWEMANGTQVKKIASHGGVLALGYAPDGRLVSGGRDGHVRIWDASGKQIRDWMPSGGEPVLEAVFNDDGKRVLTGSWNGEVKVQDAASDAPPLLLPGNPPSIEMRLAALDKELQNRNRKVQEAAAALAEKEKAVAAAEAEIAAARPEMVALEAQHKGALELVEKQKAASAKLDQARQTFAASLKTTQQELTATVAAQKPDAAGSGTSSPKTSAASPEVQAVIARAGDAVASLDSLNHVVLEKMAEALKQAVADCEKALALSRVQEAEAAKAVEGVVSQLAAAARPSPEKDKALADLKAGSAKAAVDLETAKSQAAATVQALAKWKAARHQKGALALRAEAKELKEKWDNVRDELAGLESAVTTAPPATQAQRVAELKQLLTTLPAEANVKQQAADAAWQEYQKLLPK